MEKQIWRQQHVKLGLRFAVERKKPVAKGLYCLEFTGVLCCSPPTSRLKEGKKSPECEILQGDKR